MATETVGFKNIVLVVDDEQVFLRAATIAVSTLGLRALVAQNGAEGLATFSAAQNEICLVLADVVMPGMDGIEMANRILALDSSVKILLMSGYSETIMGGRELPLIRKPFLPDGLARKIHETLTRANAA